MDPEVFVPEPVRRAAANADAAMQAANAPAEPAAPANANEFISIAPAAPPQKLPGSVTTVGNTPPAEPQQPPAPAQPEPNYEHMYQSMLGRHRQASEALIQANNRIEALEAMLASMRDMPASPSPQAAPQSPAQPLVTQKDIEEVGPDLIDLMRRISKEQMPASTLPPTVLDEIKSLREQVAGTRQVVTTNARQDMHNKLDTEMPDWQAINHNPDFHAWLALPDAYSGVTRQKLLTEAYGQNNAARVLQFFRGFASELAATRPTDPSVIQPQPQVPSRPAPSGPTLAELAAPGRARVAAAPTPPAEKQTIYTSDINAFYADVRKGAYRGREQLQQQLEAELHTAMRENRVVKNT